MCNEIKMMPKFSLPVIALASSPGSGNTWLRYLIERATGIYSGSIYDDKELMKGGFVGEKQRPYTGRTIVVKMHEIKRPLKINRTILLVRDPYDAILSDFNRRTGSDTEDVHTRVVQESLYKTRAWPKCVKDSAGGMKYLLDKVVTLLAPDGRLLVVYYHDLKNDLQEQLRRIIKFVGLSVDEQRLKCTLKMSEGLFRRPRYALSFNPYNKQLVTYVEDVKMYIGNVMEQYHLPSPRFEESRYNDGSRRNET
ncbi:putative WSC domain-containing protein 2 [Apostichopus japonicus]|uniref:Putative WSC domain-containing protein 2 n=1 Tax=Stichopus japonicus TaxID=307972 RepID=A0A2G8JT74_STIJA|nr:putative WSC domain-containing protein 2 [Apostichopus japonicus]